jgi:hypothetical protein
MVLFVATTSAADQPRRVLLLHSFGRDLTPLDVRLLAGKTDIQSSPGRGTILQFWLPLRETDDHQLAVLVERSIELPLQKR